MENMKKNICNTGCKVENKMTKRIQYLIDRINNDKSPNRLLYGLIKSGQINFEEYDLIIKNK